MNTYEEGSKFWAENCSYSATGAGRLWSEKQFCREFREHARCSLQDAQKVARREFMEKALYDAEDIGDLKNIIARLIDGS